MKRLLILALCTALAGSLHAQRAVQKNPNSGALIEGFATGANTLTISASGTLTWTSGATLDGASLFRSAAGLAIGSDVMPYYPSLASIHTESGQPSGYMLQTNGLGLFTARDMSNVENTALSTWTGTTNVTTLGTIGTGTWQGTAVGVSYGGTGATTAAGARVALLPSLTSNAGKVLAVNAGATDVEWITAASGGGLTIGTTTITSGTSGRVLYDNGGVVGELSTSGSGNIILDTSPTITTAALSGTQTITKSSPSLSAPQLKIVGYGNNITCYDDDATTLRWYVNIGRFFGRDFNDVQNKASLGRDGSYGLGLANDTGIFFSSDSTWYGTTGAMIITGTGSPEGVKTAPVGSLYLRQDGGTSTTFYVKESGSGNTGWIAK